MSALSDPNEPQFRKVGQVEGDHIVWDDGSPPTPVPSGSDEADTNPADAVCQSEADQ